MVWLLLGDVVVVEGMFILIRDWFVEYIKIVKKN